MLLWLSLAVAIVATIAAVVFAVRRGLEAFRAAKALSRTAAGELARIEESSARIEAHLALAAESGTRLDASLVRLRRSNAQLNVLRSAIDDVRDSVGRWTSVYPRK
jgi:hypothetical protein